MPSNYYRNIIKIIPDKISLYDVGNYYDKLSEIVIFYNIYKDYQSVGAKKALDVAFSSKFSSLKEIAGFLSDEYDNIQEIQENNVEDVKNIIKENDLEDDVKILYNKNNKLILVVFSHLALRKLTCNTKYCFSRTGTGQQWNTYADGSHVILFYDFDYDYPYKLTTILPTDLAYYADNTLVQDEDEEPYSERKILRKYISKNVIDDYIY